MSRRVLLTALIVLALELGTRSAYGQTVPVAKQVSLCSVLDQIEPGQKLRVVVSGVLQTAYEAAVLFDPATPHCDRDVQPATWVEFESTVLDNRPELERELERSRRAYVTVEGTIYGPRQVPPDDPSVPYAAAFAKRFGDRRYGHLSGWRTKLVVERVLAVREADPEAPWEWGGRGERDPGSNIAPRHLPVPSYPRTAQELGVTGEVRVLISIERGRVIDVEALSGDRVLSEPTIESVRAWEFDGNTTTSVTTTFVYSLEWRDRGGQADVVVLNLPERVTVTGARFGY